MNLFIAGLLHPLLAGGRTLDTIDPLYGQTENCESPTVKLGNWMPHNPKLKGDINIFPF